MKKFFKLLALTLVAVMALASLAACGGSSSLSDPAVGADGKVTLVIGGIGPLTGPYANYGLSVKNGCQIAVDEINAAGGVNGIMLKLQFEDSQGDPEEAVNAYGKLIDDGMRVSLGGVLSGETASIVAAAKKDGILLLTPSGSALNAIAGNDNAFRVCFNDPQQGTISANFIADNQLATKVAVFYQSDIDYSNGLYETFKTQAATRNLEIVTTQTFTKDSATDFSTQINAIKASGADLVFIPIYADEAAVFLSQAKANGLNNVTFFGCDGIDGILTKGVTNEDVEGMMMLTPFAADSPEADVQKFVSAYTTAHGSAPDQFAADGYDAIYIIAAAMKQAGFSGEAGKVDVANFQKRLVEAMTKIEVDGVTGNMTWTADGETVKNAMALVYRDGVAVAYSSDDEK
ncbi:MAG: amino acid ABC transporter substrate-binding protein [Ruminococcaceae bacterium]|nr:amino acid ABC transporter substrate-binding protein [Oscillospiraceae bacterium]